MPGALRSRPQTLRQAKKAYNKSGGVVRLSKHELAVLERGAELQARADRIKEREARRKENLRKKEERLQKERENRKKMGLPMPGAIHVGPSQLSLGQFLGAVTKKDVGERTAGKEQGVDLLNVQEQGKESRAGLMGPPPRPVLKEISCNTSAETQRPSMPSKSTSEQGLDEEMNDFFVSNTQIERELSPPPKPSPLSFTLPSKRAPPKDSLSSPESQEEEANEILACISTQDLDFAGVFTQAPLQDDERFFKPIRRPPKEAATPSESPPQPPILSQKDRTALLHLSAQNLIQGPKQSVSTPPSRPKSYDYEDDFTDDDLNEIALELELDSPQVLTNRIMTKKDVAQPPTPLGGKRHSVPPGNGGGRRGRSPVSAQARDR